VISSLATALRELGPVIDPAAMAALYGPLLAAAPRAGVVCRRDMAYGPDERHRADIYGPEGAHAGSRPVVLFVHGGGFVRGSKEERENVGYFLARQGLVAVLPAYRLAPRDPWPSGPQDVVRAIQWAKSHVGQWGGSPQSMVLVGESAGAAHVAAAVLMKRFQPETGLGVKGAMLISGVYNAELEWLARKPLGLPEPNPRNLAYFGDDPKAYAERSIVQQIDAHPMPLLITYAELDPLQQQVQAGELFSRLWLSHGFTPAVEVIRQHNHLSQIVSMNTGDMALGQVMLDFVTSVVAGLS
jgi:acetyl esterase